MMEIRVATKNDIPIVPTVPTNVSPFVAVSTTTILSLAGASFQGIFKNPLVSPDLLGVSAGAGFGAAIAILANILVVHP